MKFILTASQIDTVLSHLTRGAWIEILPTKLADVAAVRRTSHEVRGLKSKMIRDDLYGTCRTSHEVRGLKWWLSLPEAGLCDVAPHTRCVD